MVLTAAQKGKGKKTPSPTPSATTPPVQPAVSSDSYSVGAYDRMFANYRREVEEEAAAAALAALNAPHPAPPARSPSVISVSAGSRGSRTGARARARSKTPESFARAPKPAIRKAKTLKEFMRRRPVASSTAAQPARSKTPSVISLSSGSSGKARSRTPSAPPLPQKPSVRLAARKRKAREMAQRQSMQEEKDTGALVLSRMSRQDPKELTPANLTGSQLVRWRPRSWLADFLLESQRPSPSMPITRGGQPAVRVRSAAELNKLKRAHRRMNSLMAPSSSTQRTITANEAAAVRRLARRMPARTRGPYISSGSSSSRSRSDATLGMTESEGGSSSWDLSDFMSGDYNPDDYHENFAGGEEVNSPLPRLPNGKIDFDKFRDETYAVKDKNMQEEKTLIYSGRQKWSKEMQALGSENKKAMKAKRKADPMYQKVRLKPARSNSSSDESREDKKGGEGKQKHVRKRKARKSRAGQRKR